MDYRVVQTLSTIALFSLSIAAQQVRADEWQFELAPYLWVAGADGDITINKQKFNASADFEDIIDQTKFGGSLIFSANRGHWVNFAQLDYLDLENDNVSTRLSREDLHVEVSSLLATVTTGYRFNIGQDHSLDVMAGLRYAGIDTEVDLNRLGDVNSQINSYDGIVMIRPSMKLGKNWKLMPSFSVGTGDSDLTWEVFPEIIYQPGDLKFRFGYRNLNYDTKEGKDEVDFSMRGVLFGVGFVF